MEETDSQTALSAGLVLRAFSEVTSCTCHHCVVLKTNVFVTLYFVYHVFRCGADELEDASGLFRAGV